MIEMMAYGHSKTGKKYGRSIRISHAKAHAVLKGQLVIREGLPPELAQVLSARPGTYEVLVRLTSAPGELLDDSKVNATRGMAVKVFGVKGPMVPSHTGDTCDFVFAPGKVFTTGNGATFLQAFKPNAEVAPDLSDITKGVVSSISRAARDSYVESLSFSPDHALAAHQPLGSINRARRAAYTALSAIRRRDSGRTIPAKPADSDALPA